MNGNSNTLAHSSPVRKGSSFRQIIHAAVSWLMTALAVIFGVGGTVAAFFGAAFLLDTSSALFVVAISVGFLITSGGAWIAARMMTRARPGRIALGVGAATMLLLALVTAVTIFPPLGSTAAAREADAFFNTFVQGISQGTVCDPAHLPKGQVQGYGFYDNIFTTTDAQHRHGNVNPRTLLTSNHTPTLILTGACNYIKWAVTWQYKATLPNSTLLYFPHAGHVIYLDQPALYLASIRAFLLGTPLPLPPWTTARPPDTRIGPAG